jgi:hypothetical protein
VPDVDQAVVVRIYARDRDRSEGEVRFGILVEVAADVAVEVRSGLRRRETPPNAVAEFRSVAVNRFGVGRDEETEIVTIVRPCREDSDRREGDGVSGSTRTALAVAGLAGRAPCIRRAKGPGDRTVPVYDQAALFDRGQLDVVGSAGRVVEVSNLPNAAVGDAGVERERSDSDARGNRLLDSLEAVSDGNLHESVDCRLNRANGRAHAVRAGRDRARPGRRLDADRADEKRADCDQNY